MAGEARPIEEPAARRSLAELAVRAAAVVAPLVAAVVVLGLGRATLLPGVAFWDTGEFQAVGPVLGTAHPTGFPAYVILGWLGSIILQPLGSPAFRMNLLSAILIAVAAGALAVLVRQLTGRPWIGLVAGLLFGTGPTAWDLATHADAHTLHLALLAVLLCLLVGWERRRRAPEGPSPTADRWLLAASGVYGVALADHTLALLLAPGIALFVLAVEPRIVLRPGFVLRCAALLVGVTAALYAELPIRAAMHAPLVYARPDTVGGFEYVVLAEQFRGSLTDPLADPGGKLAAILTALTSELGPLLPFAVAGAIVTAWRRPRFALLTLPAFAITCWFAASYINAEIERYYIGPILIGLAWLSVLVAAVVDVAVLAAERIADALSPAKVAAAPASVPLAAHGAPAPADRAASRRVPASPVWSWPLEAAAALVLLLPTADVLPARFAAADESHRTDAAVWLDAAFERLPADAVVVSWWSYSTPLWYGQRAEGRRPDISIIDDRTRLDEDLGTVTDVIESELGKRPVFLIRPADEMAALQQRYRLEYYETFPGFSSLAEVMARVGPPPASGTWP